MSQSKTISVMFVCMGNICRSPTAHGVFRQLVEHAGLDRQIEIASSGTHDYHVGQSPDQRSAMAAKRRGIDISDLRAQQICADDLHRYDHVLVMDQANYVLVMQACPDALKHKVGFFLDYAPHLKLRDVPDPYYGAGNGFERVLDLVEDASRGLLRALKRELVKSKATRATDESS